MSSHSQITPDYSPSPARPLAILYAAIMLDAVGIGLVFPILPRLLEAVSGAASVAPFLGAMTALYAAMQFVFAPVLGALSDRLGRRQVLLISLAGATINYLFLAFAPSLVLLFIGRAIAGLTSANVSVAAAYITDISPPATRPRRFGLSNAMFGAGFIIGPVLGGALGGYSLRLPFIAAAALTGLNLAIALFALPESRPGSRARLDLAALNPLRPLRWAFSMRSLTSFVLIFLVFSATGEAYGTCWALWGHEAFRWNGLLVGLSLGAFGICQTLAQAILPGPATRLLGERSAILTGVAVTSAALVDMAFATAGRMVFAIMPLFALGGIGIPALQSLATQQLGEGLQGQFQGLLASAVSLASVVVPLGFSTVYLLTHDAFPGAVWLHDPPVVPSPSRGPSQSHGDEKVTTGPPIGSPGGACSASSARP